MSASPDTGAAPAVVQRTAWWLFAPPAGLAALRWLLQWQSERAAPSPALPLQPLAEGGTLMTALMPLFWGVGVLLVLALGIAVPGGQRGTAGGPSEPAGPAAPGPRAGAGAGQPSTATEPACGGRYRAGVARGRAQCGAAGGDRRRPGRPLAAGPAHPAALGAWAIPGALRHALAGRGRACGESLIMPP